MADLYHRRRMAHIPVLVFLQIIFIILFGVFVVYDPKTAVKSNHADPESLRAAMSYYPMFQDVHVMIFIGFGFLMTFLKKYGLSAISLNMLCAVISLQWAILVNGFFHLHHSGPPVEGKDGEEEQSYSHGYIYANLLDSMLLSDFATATVLISFGVLIGKTSPLQLIIMVMCEVVLFVVNEVIGRKYLGAIDAGDTIFVHLFGAVFGLAASKVLYEKKYLNQEKQGSKRTSDLFSMIGTVFLWLFWPSFNAAAAVNEGQHRAVINTFLSLCGSVVVSFAISAATNRRNKFVMEHIQNATLAGGVAIGAAADLMVQPFGALIIGSFAGGISTLGFCYVTPFLERKLKIHDTCGVNNLHGIPAILGSIISCIMAATATEKLYGGSEGLSDVYPLLVESEAEDGSKIEPITPSQQAVNQFLAQLVTVAIAAFGGALTGYVMRMVGAWQHLDEAYHKGMTILKLAVSAGSVTSGVADFKKTMPLEVCFDDQVFFEVHEDNSDEESEDLDIVVITDEKGAKRTYKKQ